LNALILQKLWKWYLDENLKRWAEDAGLDPTGITIKISRKT